MGRDGVPRRGDMRDVAREAGVSVSTVSNVLNRPDVVAERTRLRVEQAMTTVSFVRNGAARQMRGAPPAVVGAVVRDVASPFYGEVGRGMEDRLAQAGCLLLSCSTDARADNEARLLRMLEEHGVRGVLLSPVGVGPGELAAMAGRGTPVVMLDHPRPGPQMCAVTVDNRLGGRLAAEHLLRLGHRRIAFLRGPCPDRTVLERRAGVLDALLGADLDPATALAEVEAAGGGADAAEAAVGSVLARRDPPTAVLCMSDLAALGFLRGLRARGIAVPGQMSIVGYGDTHFAAALKPALTTVRRPAYDLGRAAAELLLAEPEPGHHHREQLFDPELVVRASTAPPV